MLETLAAAAVPPIATIALVLLDLGGAVQASPDARYYLAAGAGKPVPSPYSRRWLLPFLLRDRPLAWMATTALSLLAWGVLIAVYAKATTPSAAILASALLCGLSMFRTNVFIPFLVDAPAFALALASAVAIQSGHPILAVTASVLAGAACERAPVFAALFAWSPWPLLGLLGAGWLRTKAPADQPWLREPMKTALARHAGAWLNWREVALPWGAILPLALPYMDGQCLAALAVGYGQMLIAQDRARLFLWAAPVLIAHGMPVPQEAVAAVLLVHALNPYRGI